MEVEIVSAKPTLANSKDVPHGTFYTATYCGGSRAVFVNLKDITYVVNPYGELAFWSKVANDLSDILPVKKATFTI